MAFNDAGTPLAQHTNYRGQLMSAIQRPSDDLVLRHEDVTNAVSPDKIEINIMKGVLICA